MRWSRFYLFTTREVPRDAEVPSHQLMVRAGMVKKLAAGIYTYLPLGWRSIAKLTAIVRREMDAAGAIELSMPAVQPAELWQETGRWEVYGDLLLRMKDRHDRDFCFGPTHEEVVTDTVRHDVRSYRQLPFNLYQIQTKFRDEIRPRFGLMRGREFIMKDAYSFHANEESLGETYNAMKGAYARILEQCGLDYVVVEADPGDIGGSSSHEFMVLAETGENAVVRCPSCDYGANVERAESRILDRETVAQPEPRREVATPGASSVAEVAEMLRVPPAKIVKTLIYHTEAGPVAAVVRGDREINEVKLSHLLGVPEVRLADDQEVARAAGSPVGFSGPVGLPAGVRLVADESVRALRNFVCGANKADTHLTGVNWGRDAEPERWADLLRVGGGDPCPRCAAALEQFRGIEVGHVFMLGDKYSRAMGCVYSDAAGESQPMIMGCYGLGVGRTLAAAIEQNHDEDGISWPLPLAPFQVEILALQPNEAEVSETADRLHAALEERGIEVLYDDRDERPGVKFNDADLIGIPLRVVIGSRSLAEGRVEISLRRDRERQLVATADAVERVARLLAG